MKIVLMLLLAVPPATIFGRYGADTDHFEITRGKANAVNVTGEVHGPGDQVCTFEGSGAWKDGALRVPYEDCTLVITFRDGKLITDDHTLACRKAALCGDRVGLDGWELPKIVEPPQSIFGRYSETGDESFIAVEREADQRIHVTGDLAFLNGHSCTIDGYGTWTGGTLHVPHGDDCDLILHFKDGVVTTEDPEGNCKWALCGARGGFQNIALPKEK